MFVKSIPGSNGQPGIQCIRIGGALSRWIYYLFRERERDSNSPQVDGVMFASIPTVSSTQASCNLVLVMLVCDILSVLVP
jgi:hypothetical protein